MLGVKEGKFYQSEKKKKKLFLSGKGENESQIKYEVGKKESQGKFYLA